MTHPVLWVIHCLKTLLSWTNNQDFDWGPIWKYEWYVECCNIKIISFSDQILWQLYCSNGCSGQWFQIQTNSRIWQKFHRRRVFELILEFWLASQWVSIQNPFEAKSPIDPSTEQNGYLLISHMIAKYNLPRSLILSCFEKLLKSYTLEVKLIVNEG